MRWCLLCFPVGLRGGAFVPSLPTDSREWRSRLPRVAEASLVIPAHEIFVLDETEKVNKRLFVIDPVNLKLIENAIEKGFAIHWLCSWWDGGRNTYFSEKVPLLIRRFVRVAKNGLGGVSSIKAKVVPWKITLKLTAWLNARNSSFGRSCKGSCRIPSGITTCVGGDGFAGFC